MNDHPKLEKKPQVSSRAGWKTACIRIRGCSEVIEKEQYNGRFLKVLGWVKNVRNKGPQNVWFHAPAILAWAKPRNENQWHPELEKGTKMERKMQERTLSGDESVCIGAVSSDYTATPISFHLRPQVCWTNLSWHPIKLQRVVRARTPSFPSRWESPQLFSEHSLGTDSATTLWLCARLHSSVPGLCISFCILLQCPTFSVAVTFLAQPYSNRSSISHCLLELGAFGDYSDILLNAWLSAYFWACLTFSRVGVNLHSSASYQGACDTGRSHYRWQRWCLS